MADLAPSTVPDDVAESAENVPLHGAGDSTVDLMLNSIEDDHGGEEVVDIESEEKTASIAIGDEAAECVECRVCRMDRSMAEMHPAPCGHQFCRWCLETHYRSSIANGTVTFECIEELCDRPIADEELMLFLDDLSRSKYAKFARNALLVQDPDIRWCVKRGCEHEIRRQNKRQKRMECGRCGTAVCYDCSGLYHNTASGEHDCETVKRADSKCSEWANAGGLDVQNCPKCAARIEKNAGCNHLTCSYCKYQFCWLCRKEFKKGHYDRSNILRGCPGAETSDKRPNKCGALCLLMKGCVLMSCLPLRICWWRMNEQGFPWCCCWCCCQD